jgi:hypothetical protein
MNYPTQTDAAKDATTYNGWSNYETWNVSLYINNEYNLYQMACAFVRERKYYGQVVNYQEFSKFLPNETPDGVSYTHLDLDHKELDEMLLELVD